MTDTTNDLFDGASSTFPSKKDLDGRLIAIWATGQGSRQGTNGKPYPYVETDTMVLDGEVTELITEVPSVLPAFQHSTTGLVARLKGRIGNPKPMIGRMNSQPSRVNRDVLAYSIAEPTAADMDIIRKHEALIRAKSAEMAKPEELFD